MEKRLEKMRKDIQTRLKRKMGLLACVIILMGVVGTGRFPVKLVNENVSDFVLGFQVGLLIVVAVFALNQVVKYQKALKDDTKLKQLYYKEHDERVCYIQQKVGKSSMEITVVLMVVIAVIAGYFSFEVFLTLLAAVVLQLLINLGLKAYYSQTMSGEE